MITRLENGRACCSSETFVLKVLPCQELLASSGVNDSEWAMWKDLAEAKNLQSLPRHVIHVGGCQNHGPFFGSLS